MAAGKALGEANAVAWRAMTNGQVCLKTNEGQDEMREKRVYLNS